MSTFGQELAGAIIPLADAAQKRAQLRAAGRRVVATNGCFDLLHVGHLRYLTAARARGDFLWVGLNGDDSVRQLKGAGRPLIAEVERAELLAGLRVVDAVTIFPQVRATAFLRAVHPDLYIKGGDYTLDSLDAEERAALQAGGAEIALVGLVPGRSSSALLAQLRGAALRDLG